MSRSGDEPRGASAVAAATLRCLILVCVALARPAAAAEAPTAGGFELSRGVRQSLQRLQDDWLRWVSAMHRGDRTGADAAIRGLSATGAEVGFPRLGDLALGAAARAVVAAEAADPERAAWALAAADQLDPGRPETDFARARAARREGRWAAAFAATAVGSARVVWSRAGELGRADLGLVGLAVFAIAAGLFVAVQMAIKGSALYVDLHAFLGRTSEPTTAHVWTALLLFWPLALPSGPLWLLLYWSALLWSYLSASERWVTVACWLGIAVAPWLVDGLARRVALAQSPPTRAIRNLEAGRLYGGLFSDLQVLQAALPNDPATLELLGDVHRIVGQWEFARTHYRAVLQQEPRSFSALVNLGAFYHRKGEFATAVDYFRRASEVDPESALAFYDLSLAYSESYQFEESRQSLAQARSLDEVAVAQWVGAASPDRVLSVSGGIARADDVARALASARSESADEGLGRIAASRRYLSVSASILAAALAAVAHWLRRRQTLSDPVSWLPARGIARWLRAVVAPLAAAEEGRGIAGFGGTCVLSALVVAPFAYRFASPIPLAIDPGVDLGRIVWWVAIALWLAWRGRVALRGGR